MEAIARVSPTTCMLKWENHCWKSVKMSMNCEERVYGHVNFGEQYMYINKVGGYREKAEYRKDPRRKRKNARRPPGAVAKSTSLLLQRQRRGGKGTKET